MKIRMLKASRGSPDGINLEFYSQGATYDLSGTERERDLAAAFIRYGWAEEVRMNVVLDPATEKKGPGRK